MPSCRTAESRAVTIDWTAFARRRDEQQRLGKGVALWLTDAETRILIEDRDGRRALLFELLWSSGARVSEALAVRSEDLVTDERGTRVRLGRGRREVPLVNGPLIERLGAHGAGRGGQPLIGTTRQTAGAWLGQRVERLRREGAPLPAGRITLSTFRDTFAVNALLHAVPLSALRRWLGHAQISTTARYLECLEDEDGALARRARGYGTARS